MSNSTAAANLTTVQYANKYQQQTWVISVTVNAVCLAILTWMTFTLTLYGVQTGKWKEKKSKHSAEAGAGRVYGIGVLAMVCGFVRLCSDQASFNVGYAPDRESACRGALQASSVGYIITICLVYIFLWLRQRAFYQHPVLKQHYNKCLIFLSWASIVVILMGLLLTLVLYVAFNQFTSSANGCELLVQSDATQWPAYMSTGITTVGQLLMLFLFGYPLRFQAARQNAKRMIRLLKRCGVMVMVCMTTDAIASAYLRAPPAPHLPWMFFSVNMTLNLLGVFLSFETWFEIAVWPFKSCIKMKPKEETTSGSRTVTDL